MYRLGLKKIKGLSSCSIFRSIWLSLGGGPMRDPLAILFLSITYIYFFGMGKQNKTLLLFFKLLCQEESGTSLHTERPLAMAVVLSLECASDSCGGMLKQISSHQPPSSDSVDLRWGPGIWIVTGSQVLLMLWPRDPTRNLCSVCPLCGSCPLTVAVSPLAWLTPEAARNHPQKRVFKTRRLVLCCGPLKPR